MRELKIGYEVEFKLSMLGEIMYGKIVNVHYKYCGRTEDGKYGIRKNVYEVENFAGFRYSVPDEYITRVKAKISETDEMIHWEWMPYEEWRKGFDVPVSEDVKNYIHRDNMAIKNVINSEFAGFRKSGRYPWNSARGYIYSFKPKKVIFNGPATIVIWKDGTKTIVKRRECEEDDREKAIMYCILKKMCGNKAAMDKYLKLFLKEESNDEEKEETGSSKSDWKKPRAGSGSSEGNL